MNRESAQTIRLRSADGKVFTVKIAVIAKMSVLISTLVEDLDLLTQTSEEEIPFPNLSGEIMEKIIQWCERNYPRDGDQRDEQLEEWNRSFLDVDVEVLRAIMKAADYLMIKGLYDVSHN